MDEQRAISLKKMGDFFFNNWQVNYSSTETYFLTGIFGTYRFKIDDRNAINCNAGYKQQIMLAKVPEPRDPDDSDSGSDSD